MAAGGGEGARGEGKVSEWSKARDRRTDERQMAAGGGGSAERSVKREETKAKDRRRG